MKTTQRRILSLSAASLAGMVLPVAATAAPAVPPAAYLLPGYRPSAARVGGRPLTEVRRFTRDVPAAYGGPVTLVTRVAPGQPTRRAILPVGGHKIIVGGPNKAAFFSSIRGVNACVFDPDTLAVDRVLGPHDPAFKGGGHSLFTPDGSALLVVERPLVDPGKGAPADHYGSLVVRDAKTFEILTVHSCHGILPHDMAFLDNGRLVAIANYGSRLYRDTPAGTIPDALEPSVTVVDVASGKLVHKVVGTPGTYEIRHLSAAGRGRIAAIQTRLTSRRAAETAMPDDLVYTADETETHGRFYAPAPVLSLSLDAPRARAMAGTPSRLSRQG